MSKIPVSDTPAAVMTLTTHYCNNTSYLVSSYSVQYTVKIHITSCKYIIFSHIVM